MGAQKDFSYNFRRVIPAGAAEAAPVGPTDAIVFDLKGYSGSIEADAQTSLLLLAVGDAVDYEIAFWNGTNASTAAWVIAGVGTLTDGTPTHITFPYQGARIYVRKTNVTASEVQLFVGVSNVDVPGAGGGGGGGAGDASEATLSAINVKTPTLGQKTMAGSSPVVIASNQSDVPVSATALPLPTGAATEATLSALNTKTPAVGQALMAASSPVVIASNQSAVPVSAASLPLPTGAATEATLSALNTKMPAQGQALMAASVPVVLASNQSAVAVSNAGITSIDGKIPSLGQATMAASTPVVIASNQTAIPVTGSFNNTSVDATGAAVPADATYIAGNLAGNLTGITLADGDTGAGTAPILQCALALPDAGGPTLVSATDPLPVAIISGGGGGGGGGTSEGATGAAVPANATQVGGSDGTNLQSFRVMDGDTGGGSHWVQEVVSVLPGSGGPVVAGSVGNALHVIVDSGGGGGNAEGTNGAASPTYSVQTGGTDGTNLQPFRVADGDTGGGTQYWQGVIPMVPKSGGAAVVSSSDPMPVAVISGGGANASVSATGAAVPASATMVGGSDGTNLQAVRVVDADTGAGSQWVLPVVPYFPASGGGAVAGTTTDPYFTVARGPAADNAAATGNPVQIGGVYRASPTALADGDIGALLLDNLYRLLVKNAGYDETLDVQKVADSNPLYQQYSDHVLAAVTAGNGASGDTDYYFSMDGFKSGTIQLIMTPGTATLAVSVWASAQDDGTAAASCSYVDVGSAWFGSATFAGTASPFLLHFVDKGVKFIRVRVNQTVTTNGAWTIHVKRMW